MIIWSGWGLLTAVFAFIGAVLGVISGSFLGPMGGGVIGGCLAAYLNHIVAKSAGKGKVLIDPATNQEVHLKKSNSLFFIPMSWFTPLLLLGGLAFGILATLGNRADKEMDQKYPGKAVFEETNKRIGSTRKATALGNNPAAEKAASDFSVAMKSIQSVAFEGATEKYEDKHFATYCLQTEDSVVFITQVPGMRKYKDEETKKALDTIAWNVATDAANELPNVTAETNLIVALRGIAVYGSIQDGKLGTSEPISGDDKKILYTAFAPVDPIAE